MRALVSSDVINKKIFVLRGHKVMLSPHLAELYGVAVSGDLKVAICDFRRNKRKKFKVTKCDLETRWER